MKYAIFDPASGKFARFSSSGQVSGVASTLAEAGLLDSWDDADEIRARSALSLWIVQVR